MNQKTAKLIRRYCHVTGRKSADAVKWAWNNSPKRKRHGYRLEMERKIAENA